MALSGNSVVKDEYKNSIGFPSDLNSSVSLEARSEASGADEGPPVHFSHGPLNFDLPLCIEEFCVSIGARQEVLCWG
ncbi:unnamed protein product, partial [Pleuronectes platessa]